jgi:hypothetical protein
MKEFYQSNGVNPGRSGFDKALEAEEVVHPPELLTRLFNGTDPTRVTFSYIRPPHLNRIIQGMVSKGDHVITQQPLAQHRAPPALSQDCSVAELEQPRSLRRKGVT